MHPPSAISWQNNRHRNLRASRRVRIVTSYRRWVRAAYFLGYGIGTVGGRKEHGFAAHTVCTFGTSGDDRCCLEHFVGPPRSFQLWGEAVGRNRDAWLDCVGGAGGLVCTQRYLQGPGVKSEAVVFVQGIVASASCEMLVWWWDLSVLYQDCVTEDVKKVLWKSGTRSEVPWK